MRSWRMATAMSALAVIAVLSLSGFMLVAAEAQPGGGEVWTQCGRVVSYRLPVGSRSCLIHNATSTSNVRSTLYHGGKVVAEYAELPSGGLELPRPPLGSMLVLVSSAQSVCYRLSPERCIKAWRRERVVRATVEHATQHDDRSSSPHLVLLGVFSTVLLSTLAMAASLCCPGKGRSQANSPVNNDISKVELLEGKGSNITDSDHPLGSEHYTTFIKTRTSMKQGLEKPPSIEKKLTSAAEVDDLHNSSRDIMFTQNSRTDLMEQYESSLDIGTRESRRYAVTSLSSMHSLGPRVSPEGSSGVLPSSDSQLSMIKQPISRTSSPHTPLPSIPPPIILPSLSSHIRQHSTPVSLPQLMTSPTQLRPVSLLEMPCDQHSDRYSQGRTPPLLPPLPLLPSKPTASPPPLSPVSLSDSEILSPRHLGRIQPYRVVISPSPQGLTCAECGRRVDIVDPGVPQPESGEVKMQDKKPLDQRDENGDGAAKPGPCSSCRTGRPQAVYQRLESSDEEPLSPSPPLLPSTLQRPPVPDPVYERIGSIVRRHPVLGAAPAPITKPLKNLPKSDRDKEKPRMATPPLPDAPLPSHPGPVVSTTPQGGYIFTYPDHSNPFRPSSSSDHDYESLPSSFDQPPDQALDTSLYARIEPVEGDEPESPPYIPENSQRTQMLKIDSQGYAVIMNDEEEAEEQILPPAPVPSYSNTSVTVSHPPQSSATPCDYEVPISALQTSSAFLSASYPPPTPLRHPDSTWSGPRLTRQSAQSLASEERTKRDLSPSSHGSSRPGSSSSERRRSGDSLASNKQQQFSQSLTSSGIGESRDSVFTAIDEAINELQEMEEKLVEEGLLERGDLKGKCDDGKDVEEGSTEGCSLGVQKRSKVYEVENLKVDSRNRAKSFIHVPVKQVADRQRTQSVNVIISFDKDSQTLV